MQVAWETEVGTRKEPIYVEDVVNTLDACKSVILKELHYNDSIKDNEKARQMYEKHHGILVVLRARFQDIIDQPNEPIKVIPSKRYHK
jgi:hypothetical protein